MVRRAFQVLVDSWWVQVAGSDNKWNVTNTNALLHRHKTIILRMIVINAIILQRNYCSWCVLLCLQYLNFFVIQYFFTVWLT